MNSEDDDPTIICNMMEKFRASSSSYYRSSMLPSSNIPNTNIGISNSKPRRLRFDTSSRSHTECPDKKIKLSTPRESDGSNEIMSPWEIRRIKSEMIKSRSQVIEVEERLSKLQGLKLETELLYAKEKMVLEESLQQERQKVTELENRLQFIRNREVETIEQSKQIQACENDKKLTDLLSELQKENIILKEQLFESKNELENINKKEKVEVDQLHADLEAMKRENESNTQLIESLRNELCEKGSELRKLEMEQTKLLNITKRVKDLESEREAYMEMRSYVESQSKKLMHFSEMEKDFAEAKDEIKRLKSAISNTMYLEEIVEDLKTREKQRVNLDQEIITLRTECQNQRIELENWCCLAKHYCISDENSKPLLSVKMRLEELVRKELWYISESKNLELKLGHLKEKLVDRENETIELKKQCEELKASCEAHASNNKRLKKQLTLVSWERNDLRNVVDSCQKEMTINSEAHNQLDSLQKVIDGYRQRTEQIENDPSLAALGIGIKSSERDELLKQEALLKEENKKLREKVQQLSDQLEYRNLKGDFDPRRTKILHLKSNPTAEATQSYIDKLTKANEEIVRLQERITVLEEGNDEDVTRIVEERVQTNSVKEVNDLKERIKSLEIQNQRLCEVFKKKTHDIREAMNMLFGYRIDVLPCNQFRLRSQYAYDSDDILLFQISQADNGTMELLETSFSESLTDLIDLHLKQHKSIPVFLASVTVDLFNKLTVTSFSATESTICME